MRFMESVKMAISAVLANKMRSLLTMLGIIIGIASVIAVVGVGEGARGSINGIFEDIGVNRAAIVVGKEGSLTQQDMINENDIAVLERVLGDKLKGINPANGLNGTMVNNRKTYDISVRGVVSNYMDIQKLDMVGGRFIVQSDIDASRGTVVIDDKLAKKLWNTTDVVGNKLVVDMNGQSVAYTIVGVYEKKEQSVFGQSIGNESFTVYAPYTQVDEIRGSKFYWQLEMTTETGEDVVAVMKDAVKILNRLHGNDEKDSFVYYTAEQQMESFNQVFGMMTALVSAIAGISLLVGGIGIMNIMLVSVTERTREIGIRKAIGAKRMDIMIQFMIESAIISAIGGVVGVALGFGFAQLGGIFTKAPPVIGMNVIATAVLFSAGVGIFFGLYPANKAAKLDPIEALRYE